MLTEITYRKSQVPDTRHLKWNEVTNWAPTAPQWEELTLQSVSADGRRSRSRARCNSIISAPAMATESSRSCRTWRTSRGTSSSVGIAERLVRDQGPCPLHAWSGHRRALRALHGPGPHDDRAREQCHQSHGALFAAHHHMMGPQTTPANGYQFTLIGNAIDGGSVPHDLKWGFTIHNCHYGLIQDNVGYNYGGTIFMFEDGSESYNVVDHNFAIRSRGTGDYGWRRAPKAPGSGSAVRTTTFDAMSPPTSGATPRKRLMGSSFSCGSSAISTSPTSRAPTPQPREIHDERWQQAPHPRVHRQRGLWGCPRHDVLVGELSGPSTLQHRRGNGHPKPPHLACLQRRRLSLPFGPHHLRGLVIRGKDPAASACCGRGWFAADYAAKDIVIRNADIQGMQRGIITSEFQYGTGSIENSYFRTSDYAIAVQFLGQSITAAQRAFPPRRLLFVIHDSTRCPALHYAALAQAVPVLPRGTPMPHLMKSRSTTIKAIRVIIFRCTGQTLVFHRALSKLWICLSPGGRRHSVRHPRRSRRRHDGSGCPDKPASHAVTATVAAASGRDYLAYT